MIRKSFNILNVILAFSLSVFSLNLTVSKLNPDKFFPLIFICIGFSNTLLGINLLNADKKVLSFFSFLLAGFFFISVGIMILMNN